MKSMESGTSVATIEYIFKDSRNVYISRFIFSHLVKFGSFLSSVLVCAVEQRNTAIFCPQK